MSLETVLLMLIEVLAVPLGAVAGIIFGFSIVLVLIWGIITILD